MNAVPEAVLSSGVEHSPDESRSVNLRIQNNTGACTQKKGPSITEPVKEDTSKCLVYKIDASKKEEKEILIQNHDFLFTSGNVKPLPRPPTHSHHIAEQRRLSLPDIPPSPKKSLGQTTLNVPPTTLIPLSPRMDLCRPRKA